MSSSLRCLVLFSGGLDSQVAVRIMQEQGIEVEAVNFKTPFTCCQDFSAKVARELGVRLTILSAQDDYFDLVRHPQFGYGKGANPCIDCRIYMFQQAVKLLHDFDAKFLVSGEVLGQRPKSQKRLDLEIIAHHASEDDLLLRPLSAKHLPPTLPEREGWVQRDQLYGFVGRSRKGIIDLAKRLGLKEIPSPSNGCALTEKAFSRKVFDLVQLQPQNERWDFELLSVGRHFRYSSETKIIVARNEVESDHLRREFAETHQTATANLFPANFQGPDALVLGELSATALGFAAALIRRFSREVPLEPQVLVRTAAGERSIPAEILPAAEEATTIAQTARGS